MDWFTAFSDEIMIIQVTALYEVFCNYILTFIYFNFMSPSSALQLRDFKPVVMIQDQPSTSFSYDSLKERYK